MASPDKTWSTLITDLADNNTGAISEEDIRSIARWAKVSYAQFGASNAVNNDLSWTGQAPINNNHPTASPRYTKIVGAKDYSLTDSGDLDITTNGIKYGVGGSDIAVAPRLVTFQWFIEVWGSSAQSYALAFHWIPSGGTLTGTTTKRHMTDRLLFQTDGTDSNVTTFYRNPTSASRVAKGSGSASIVLAPGDELVPVLEHYGPDSSDSSIRVNYQIMAHTVGVVPSWSPSSTYWDTVSNKTFEDAVPGGSSTEASPAVRSTGKLE